MPRHPGQNPVYTCVRCGVRYQCRVDTKHLPCRDCRTVLTAEEKLAWGYPPRKSHKRTKQAA